MLEEYLFFFGILSGSEATPLGRSKVSSKVPGAILRTAASIVVMSLGILTTTPGRAEGRISCAAEKHFERFSRRLGQEEAAACAWMALRMIASTSVLS